MRHHPDGEKLGNAIMLMAGKTLKEAIKMMALPKNCHQDDGATLPKNGHPRSSYTNRMFTEGTFA